MNFDSYLASVTKCLKDDGYGIRYDVPYKGQEFKCIAKHGTFRAEFFGFYAEFFFIFAQFPTTNLIDLKDYSSKCFSYAKRYKIIPFLPFVLFANYSVFSVAIVDYIDDITIEAIRKKDPPKHSGAREQMVIYTLNTGQLYYSETNPLWGGLYHDYYRQVASTYLIPD